MPQLAIHLKDQQQITGQGRISDEGGLIRQLSVIDLPGALSSSSGTPLLATHVKALLTERIDRLRPSQQLTLKVHCSFSIPEDSAMHLPLRSWVLTNQAQGMPANPRLNMPALSSHHDKRNCWKSDGHEKCF